MMFARIRHLFKEDDPAALLAAVPPGQRIYAVGDIHGRLDLFEALIGAIEEDDRAAGPARTCVILLGDLVDRGPESAGVLERARVWQQKRPVQILAGNHEEMFLDSFADTDVLRHFLRHGGRETVLSFGMDADVFRVATLEEVQALMIDLVPQDVRDFIAGFEDMIEAGDYLFVHAGIDPAVALDQQTRESLRWIREPFLSHGAPLGKVVVHGHTIRPQVEERAHRIGIDTGAYASGRLTALVLEGAQRRYLEAVQEEDGTIRAGPKE